MKKIDDITSQELIEEIAKLEKEVAKKKKQLTQKQREALAKGREAQAIKTRARQYKQALQMQMRANPLDKIVTFQQFEARIRYSQREYGITRTQAIKKITTSRMFRTQDELFKMAVKSYAQLTDFTTIRKYIWTILKDDPEYQEAVQKKWITYATTKINWDEFVYDDFLKALVYERNSRKIIIKVKHGKNSLDPDWLSIELI